MLKIQGAVIFHGDYKDKHGIPGFINELPVTGDHPLKKSGIRNIRTGLFRIRRNSGKAPDILKLVKTPFLKNDVPMIEPRIKGMNANSAIALLFKK